VRRTLGAERGAGASRLHLHEDQGGALQRDDVELSRGKLHVASDDPPTGPLEAGCDKPLGVAAEALAGEGHDGPRCPSPTPAARIHRNGSVTAM